MANFMGGSAYAMAHQIGEGHILVTERTFGRFERPELTKLSFEMEKMMREVRAEQHELGDTQAIQVKQRKLSRLRTALMILKNAQQGRRGGG